METPKYILESTDAFDHLENQGTYEEEKTAALAQGEGEDPAMQPETEGQEPGR